MTDKSISAYSDDERVQQYDTDMDVMHPKRHKMIDIALEILPYQPADKLCALDLGIGTGFFALRFLQKYPDSSVTGVDGSEAMIGLARSGLQNVSQQLSFVNGSFVHLKDILPQSQRFDVIFSSYSLHHLDKDTKRRVLGDATSLLKEGGWFVNADLIVARYSEMEDRMQDIRIQGIHSRSSDERFKDPVTIRKFLDDLEKNEGDQPITIDEDLKLLRESGVGNATVFWQEYREVVYGGRMS